VLATNMREIHVAKQRAKELLTQMMPREVALQLLKSGRNTSQICESFDEVTICFAKVCDFNGLTSNLSAMNVVNLLNNLYSVFDDVIGRHGVYKASREAGEGGGEEMVISSHPAGLTRIAGA
jgi:class 3 adenylate cyclase